MTRNAYYTRYDVFFNLQDQILSFTVYLEHWHITRSLARGISATGVGMPVADRIHDSPGTIE